MDSGTLEEVHDVEFDETKGSQVENENLEDVSVDAGPTGCPARKGEDLVQLGFFPYNLSKSIIL